MEKSKVIGICGYARCGKDTLYKAFKDHGCNTKRIAFGDSIKEDLQVLLDENFGIDAWTDKDEEKSLIRPILVAYGNAKRAADPDYWIKRGLAKVTEKQGITYVFTDIRYERELLAVEGLEGYNTHSIYLERENNEPANDEEHLYITPLKEIVDTRILMLDYKNTGSLPRIDNAFYGAAMSILLETNKGERDIPES
jgi:hypothetical protein